MAPAAVYGTTRMCCGTASRRKGAGNRAIWSRGHSQHLIVSKRMVNRISSTASASVVLFPETFRFGVRCTENALSVCKNGYTLREMGRLALPKMDTLVGPSH